MFLPLGLVFSGFGVVFGGLGLLVAIPSLRAAQGGLEALRRGAVVQGQIVQVSEDTSQTINGRHPWLLRYVFDTGASVHEGMVTAWEWMEGEREPDEPVWVVFPHGQFCR